MSLVLNLKRQFALRGIRLRRSFLVNHGFTDGEARRLATGKVKTLHLDTLERLCETFQCLPNELFDWQGDASHVLSPISKSEAPNILKLLEDKSPKELEEILKRLEKGER